MLISAQPSSDSSNGRHSGEEYRAEVSKRRSRNAARLSPHGRSHVPMSPELRRLRAQWAAEDRRVGAAAKETALQKRERLAAAVVAACFVIERPDWQIEAWLHDDLNAALFYAHRAARVPSTGSTPLADARTTLDRAERSIRHHADAECEQEAQRLLVEAVDAVRRLPSDHESRLAWRRLR